MIRDHLEALPWWQSALHALFPRIELAYKSTQDIRYAVHTVLELHHASILPAKRQRLTVIPVDDHALGRWNVLVLAIEIVLSAELAWPGFVTFLLARTAVVTCLGGPDLLSSNLL